MTLHVPLAAARPTDTPAASMRTYVSPTTQPAADHALWRTEMAPGASGPLHVVDTEHVVLVVRGGLTAEVDGVTYVAGADDCLVLPAGSTRRLTADPTDGAVTVTAARAGSMARVGDGDPVAIPWAR